MNTDKVKEILQEILPALEDFLKTILLKKFGAELISAEMVSHTKVSGAFRDKSVVVSAKEKEHEAEVYIAFDEQWIPQLSSAMLGVEENEINEITSDLIKEFTTQLLSTAQINLSEQSIKTRPEDVELLKSANIDSTLSTDEYFMIQLKVEGKFEIEGDEKPSLGLWIVFSPPKSASKASGPAADEEEPDLSGLKIGADEPKVQARGIQFDSFAPNSGTMSQDEVRNLELLRDVQIVISVELGRKSVPLGEILHMVRGSVVELEKLAGEPVDVYANGQQIATGEVVVVDEHFGVRITQLVSAKERLESLG